MNGIPPGETARARRLTVATILSLILALHLPAGGRRRAVAAPQPSRELVIAFVDAPGGTLDAGTMGSISTKRTFGIRIGRPSREAQGNAMLQAFLETADPRCIVRLDGIVLGTQPRVIDRFAPIGIVTTHRLEIEVSASVPEGALLTNIGWTVTTD
ncbi:MAG TPA: hypothetical protein VF215_17385 [Thermoanaerobaculia bacterium]